MTRDSGTTVPRLTIELGKRTDGSTTFRLVRADGSATWQRHQGPTAQFFPLHDLTHYAVETTLGHGRGFYGLVAGGWELGDFGTPWPRGRIPDDADPSELIVGFLDLERASGHRQSAADYNAQLERQRAEGSPPFEPVTEAQLAAIREQVRELHERWRTLESGATMRLTFEL